MEQFWPRIRFLRQKLLWKWSSAIPEQNHADLCNIKISDTSGKQILILLNFSMCNFISIFFFIIFTFPYFEWSYLLPNFISIYTRRKIWDWQSIFCRLNKILVLLTKSFVKQKSITISFVASTNWFVRKTENLLRNQKSFVSSISTIWLVNTTIFFLRVDIKSYNLKL